MKFFRTIVFAVLCPLFATAATAGLSPEAIEKRNAAAAFALGREGALILLMAECDTHMARSKPSLDTIAQAWYQRNHSELETAFAWIDAYLSGLKENDPRAHKAASAELSQSQADALLGSSRTYFSRKLPTLASCVKAAETFVPAQTDIKNLHLNPGYEQFSEFSQTLAQMRSDPDFQVPPHVRVGFDVTKAGLKTQPMNMATLDAMYAADERGDGAGKIAILTSLAKGGDARSAQSVGLMYLNGDKVAQSYAKAYDWFYAAWTLADMDGLNALGVMLRDGLGVAPNPKLALAAFQVAASSAPTRETQARAAKNAAGLAEKLAPQAHQEVACWSLKALDAALRAPVKQAAKMVTPKTIASPERRLESMIDGSSGNTGPSRCVG